MSYVISRPGDSQLLPCGEDKASTKKIADQIVGTKVYERGAHVYTSGKDQDFHETKIAS